jgi:hypothetical protein
MFGLDDITKIVQDVGGDALGGLLSQFGSIEILAQIQGILTDSGLSIQDVTDIFSSLNVMDYKDQLIAGDYSGLLNEMQQLPGLLQEKGLDAGKAQELGAQLIEILQAKG